MISNPVKNIVKKRKEDSCRQAIKTGVIYYPSAYDDGIMRR